MTNEEAIKHGMEELEIFGGEHAEFIKKAIEALNNAPQINKNGLLVVKVDSVEELDKVNEVLVRVKGEAWGKFFVEEDWDD